MRGAPLVVAVAVVSLASVARAQDGQGATPGTVERTLDQAGTQRTYRLHVPPGAAANERLPLVVVLHGATSTGVAQEALSGFDAVADEKKFIAVYPDGRQRLWRLLGDASNPSSDVAFLGSLVDTLIAEGKADPRRVYVTGISNGALMSNYLAIALPGRFAAIAAVAGTLLKPTARRAATGRAMPVLYIHGTADPIVSYDGKVVISAEDLVAFWVRRDGCSTEPSVEALPVKTDDGTSVERRVYKGGKDGSEVVFYKVTGGGHTWPGGRFMPEKLLGKTCHDLDASRAMWEFFSRHTLPKNYR